MEKLTTYYKSPIGVLEIEGDNEAIFSIRFLDGGHDGNSMPTGARMVDKCVEQLDEYFKRNLKSFQLTLAPEGTDFQKSVWNILSTIPYGKKRSYQDIAKTLGNSSASKAVGSANGKNPIAVVIACHRVLGSKGALTGYAGGIHRKKWLIEHELGEYQTTLF